MVSSPLKSVWMMVFVGVRGNGITVNFFLI
jgi:hypothetical protein